MFASDAVRGVTGREDMGGSSSIKSGASFDWSWQFHQGSGVFSPARDHPI